jgi:hypothetical protein
VDERACCCCGTTRRVYALGERLSIVQQIKVSRNVVNGSDVVLAVASIWGTATCAGLLLVLVLLLVLLWPLLSVSPLRPSYCLISSRHFESTAVLLQT